MNWFPFTQTNRLRNTGGQDYQYDAIGNLTADPDNDVSNISWTPYGKVRMVTKTDGSTVSYKYDGSGNRIAKTVVTADSTYTLRYLRDASGNVMAIYKETDMTEQPIYGSSRLGMYKGGTLAGYRMLGNKQYELSNHLGNVLAVITDNIDLHNDSVQAKVVSVSDYYPFGLTMQGRSYNGTYRYGFQGQEKDDEIETIGSHYNYSFRIYDCHIGRFWSNDPLKKKYPYWSPYVFSGNRVIDAVELEGAEPVTVTAQQGTTYWDISQQFGVSIYELTSYNSYPADNIPVGAIINIADPNQWQFPDYLEKWINAGASVAPGDLFTHPANLIGSEEAQEIMERITPSSINLNTPGTFSDFGAYQNALGNASGMHSLSSSKRYLNTTLSMYLKEESELKTQLFLTGLYLEGALYLGGTTGLMSRGTIGVMGGKFLTSMMFQGIMNGGFRDVDVFDGIADALFMPGMSNYLGSGIDVMPFANEYKMIGVNKPIGQSLAEFGMGYFFDKKASIITGSLRPKLNNLDFNIVSGCYNTISNGAKIAGTHGVTE